MKIIEETNERKSESLKVCDASKILRLPMKLAPTIEAPCPIIIAGISTKKTMGRASEAALKALSPKKFPITIASANEPNCIAKTINTVGIRY